VTGVCTSPGLNVGMMPSVRYGVLPALRLGLQDVEFFELSAQE
jgi:hypothetical protein